MDNVLLYWIISGSIANQMNACITYYKVLYDLGELSKEDALRYIRSEYNKAGVMQKEVDSMLKVDGEKGESEVEKG